jgi:hypothetical protein
MKKVLLFALVMSFGMLMSFTSITENKANVELTKVTEYCDGWEDGYCEGWKDVKGEYSICPITPICPIPEIGKDGYRGGYNRGFKAGMRAARND